MKTAILSLLVLIAPSASFAASNILPGFRLPETENEIMADKIILEAAEKIDWDKRENNTALPITSKLEEAVFKAHNAAVAKKCGGKNLEGENCGLSFNPFVCGDFADRYYYRVEAENPESIIIRASAYEDGRDSTRYVLLNQSGWKIDSVRCALGNFN